jgi:predicted nucleic acid-binding protein
MNKIVLDSFAILTWFKKQNRWQEVESMLLRVANGDVDAYINIVNLTEIEYQIIRCKNVEEAKIFVTDLVELIGVEVVDLDQEICHKAALYKAKGNIALPDCFAMVTAQKLKAELWTGDAEFKPFENEVKIFWLN